MLELFCVFLYTDFLSNLHKKFQGESTYGTIIDCKLAVSAILFFNYADNLHAHIYSQTGTAKNMALRIKRSQNVSIHKNIFAFSSSHGNYNNVQSWTKKTRHSLLFRHISS